jgi:hypothetical protein
MNIKRLLIAILGWFLLTSAGSLATQELPQPPEGVKDWLSRALAFLYTIAHWIGQGIIAALKYIIPKQYTIPDSLIDPIGVLAMLTIFAAATEITKRLAWIIIIIGWVLIVVRIILVFVGI